jgi:PTH1 family peptidyl-tRNA hydrolase
MLLIVGLGNIGAKYQHTRHNIGFMALDALVGPSTSWVDQSKFQALTQTMTMDEREVLLAKPTTMMNDSGQAVGKLAQFYRIAPEDIWIVYDELDIPLGRLKISTDSSDNGHNGLISISQRLGHNRFWRFRLGVDTRQHREIPGLEYVLQSFSEAESELLAQSLELAQSAIKVAIKQGPVAAMQKYNKAAMLLNPQEARNKEQT